MKTARNDLNEITHLSIRIKGRPGDSYESKSYFTPYERCLYVAVAIYTFPAPMFKIKDLSFRTYYRILQFMPITSIR